MRVFKTVVWNVSAILVTPTTALAFMLGVLSVLHVRAFVHGWNIARGRP